jgi:hypothetical protein
MTQEYRTQPLTKTPNIESEIQMERHLSHIEAQSNQQIKEIKE